MGFDARMAIGDQPRRRSWRDVDGSTIKVIQGTTKAELWIPLPPAFQLRWQHGDARIW